jgi:LPXTG-site transpeptidase (sortase) family protein
MEGNIIFFDEQSNNKKQTLGRIIESVRSFAWKRLLTGFMGIAIIFCAFFYVINLNVNGLLITASSYWRPDSVRKMEISDEWVAKYNIILNDKMKITDDADNDGLTFQDEQHYNTNPFKSDTDSDGLNDGEEITKGSNPLGMGELDNDSDGLPDVWEAKFNLNAEVNNSQADPDNDGLSNIAEYAHGTDPQNPDTDGDGYADLTEIKNGYDPAALGNTKPAVIILSDKINLVAPVVWSKNEEESSLQEDLKRGVVHFPQTGIPGQAGNMIIAGHSSNYAWAKGDYNSIFRNLNKLETGDRIIVRVIQQNGKTFDYGYIISEKRVTAPDDEWIFENSEDTSQLTLSTCWPLGTDLSRLVIRAELI